MIEFGTVGRNINIIKNYNRQSNIKYLILQYIILYNIIS